MNSIITQSFKDFELLIIDGGSTDNTIDILKKYDKYITNWISEPDKGIYDAMNKGLKMSEGKWINFMNVGDSFCNNDALNEYANNALDNFSIVFSDVNILKENGVSFYAKQHGLFKWKFLLNKMPHQAIFFNSLKTKDLLYDLTFKVAADLDLLVKIYFRFGSSTFVHLPLALVNYAHGGYSSKHTKVLIEERFRIINKLPFVYRIINRINFLRQNNL